jgi:hypothetical protein
MGEDKPSSKELLFLHTISMFQAAAMQQLGKIVDPLSGEVHKDLDQARVSIDILEVLQEKTRGNLTKTEEDFLGKVLFELHMNYVDELKLAREQQKEGPTESAEKDATDGPDETEPKAGDGNGQDKDGS